MFFIMKYYRHIEKYIKEKFVEIIIKENTYITISQVRLWVTAITLKPSMSVSQWKHFVSPKGNL